MRLGTNLRPEDRAFAAWLMLGVGFVLTLAGWAFAGVELYGVGMLALGTVLSILAIGLHRTRRIVLVGAVLLLIAWSPIGLLYLIVR